MTKHQEAIITFDVLYNQFSAGHAFNIEWISGLTGIDEDRTLEILEKFIEKDYVQAFHNNGQKFYNATLQGVRAFASKNLNKPQPQLKFRIA